MKESSNKREEADVREQVLTYIEALEILTPREVEVIKYIAAGYTSKEIASNLGISVKTVQKHRENIVKKIGASGYGGLKNWCRKHVPLEIIRTLYLK